MHTTPRVRDSNRIHCTWTMCVTWYIHWVRVSSSSWQCIEICALAVCTWPLEFGTLIETTASGLCVWHCAIIEFVTHRVREIRALALCTRLLEFVNLIVATAYGLCVWHGARGLCVWHVASIELVIHRVHEFNRINFILCAAWYITFNVWHDFSTCVPWLIYTCDMTHACVRYDSFTFCRYSF